MKVVRTAALSRLTAPDFVVLFGLELVQLRKLDHFSRCLFLELAAIADFVTGRVETSYAVLIALLDFDRTPFAHATPRVSVQRVRTALQTLVDMGLVLDLDREDNKDRKGLFFRVPGRTRRLSTDAKSNRQSNRPKKPRKRATARASGRSTPKEQQTEQQGVQHETDPSAPLGGDPSLARVFPPPPAPHEAPVSIEKVRALNAETKARIAARKKK